MRLEEYFDIILNFVLVHFLHEVVKHIGLKLDHLLVLLIEIFVLIKRIPARKQRNIL